MGQILCLVYVNNPSEADLIFFLYVNDLNGTNLMSFVCEQPR